MRTFRRTFRRGFRGGFPREPVVWERFRATASGSDKDTTLSIVLFDPSTFGAGSALDERVTWLGCHLFVQVRDAVVHGTLAANDVLEFGWGVGVLGTNANLPDPFLSDDYSKRFDWLALGNVFSFSDGADHTYYTYPSQNNPDASGSTEVRIRSKRKLQEDEQVKFVWRRLGTAQGGGTMTSSTSLGIVEVSNLLQRTMRRR